MLLLLVFFFASFAKTVHRESTVPVGTQVIEPAWWKYNQINCFV